MMQHTPQSETQRKRGRDLPHDGPAPRKKAKTAPQPQIPQLALFQDQQAAS
jgi:hypothetical protein